MKKEYIKPTIMFEKMSMSTELSAHCAAQINFAEYMCPVVIPEIGETVFNQNDCDWTNNDFYVCYHVPTMDMNVFSS